MMTILVVAAHPDDEILGCGATIARFSASHDVRIAILGEGITSRSEIGETDRELRALHEHAQAAGRIVGAGSVEVGALPDNRFDTVPLLQIVKSVEELVDRLRPEIVYTHHPGDLNIDHVLTFRAVLTATRTMRGCPVRELLTFEIASSTEWAFQQLQPPFRPSVFVDVSATIERKLEAMATYEGETRPFPHPRSAEALRAQARRWGAVVGMEYAEAFEAVRILR
jgi:LmbE family N-acetylglucosaminyl deacetylase